MLDGPPERTVQNLLPFVVEDGVSAFVLAADDPRLIDAWGGDVAPAFRKTHDAIGWVAR